MGKENGGRRSNASLFILGEQTFVALHLPPASVGCLQLSSQWT